ncbi:MAPK kinase substrate protein At1g80180-like [Primulina huaijiensis]|uniref:MAPK kinase substrate protein At1g80180-like n=1 Tax=Primulina huaijiensis TaxID=1492673 RepID=UPI003CC6EBEF
MAGLQRSAVSFRRQGSSGLVWNDKLDQLINQQKQEKNHKPDRVENKKDAAAAVLGLRIERNRSTGGEKGFRSGKVNSAVEPPSPKVSACGFCGAFGKHEKNRRPRPPRSGKRGA